MIRCMARCPYCRACEVAYDWHIKEVVLNPDGGRQAACPHLVYVNGVFCQWELLPEGGTRVGLANLFWHHGGFAGMDMKEIFSRVMEVIRVPPVPDPATGELPFQAFKVRVEEEVRLTGQRLIDALDQVGWEQASDDRLAPQRYRLNGWVVFASPADAFVSGVVSPCSRKTSA